MNYKKALVTGGAGFIGSHIVDKLIQENIDVVVIDNLSVGKPDNVHPQAKLYVGDINDYALLKKVSENVDVVFHEAAKVSIRNSLPNFHEDCLVNVMGTVNVIKAVVENKVPKLVYASSMAVYGQDAFPPIPETATTKPISPYGIGKLAGESYCFTMGKNSGFDIIALRYFNTFGPRQTETPYVGVITHFAKQMVTDQHITIFGDGNQVRDFIYVGDVAIANILAMKSVVTNDVFNVGSGTGTSVNQVVNLLKQRISTTSLISYAPKHINELQDSIADSTKAKTVLGFRSQYTITDKIQEVIDYVKQK